MIFNSLDFALFLPIVFALYWLLRNRLWWQNMLVLVASYVFYGWWDWRFLLLIIFTSGCSYISGMAMTRLGGVKTRQASASVHCTAI